MTYPYELTLLNLNNFTVEEVYQLDFDTDNEAMTYWASTFDTYVNNCNTMMIISRKGQMLWNVNDTIQIARKVNMRGLFWLYYLEEWDAWIDTRDPSINSDAVKAQQSKTKIEA